MYDAVAAYTQVYALLVYEALIYTSSLRHHTLAAYVRAYTQTMDIAPWHLEYMAALFCNRAAAHMSMGRPQKVKFLKASYISGFRPHALVA